VEKIVVDSVSTELEQELKSMALKTHKEFRLVVAK
jgi:hypothetical protein